MKVLFLVQKEQRINLDHFYDEVVKTAGNCDLYYLSSDEQADLKKWFKSIDATQYDRIILFLRFKKEIKQVKFIRTIPNLVILEHDANQNYMNGKYQGKFSQHYRALPWARVLTSGYHVSRQLQAEGFDAVFVPKGYDGNSLRNLQQPRDIELGFVGSLGSKTYSQRKAMLEEIAAKENLFMTRTATGQEYLETLNRIRFFISADVGMGEYMIKNFEAMACGCVLFAWNQGDDENNALGFKDMQNIVLYSSINELQMKLTMLRDDPELAEGIARAGQQHVETYFTFSELAKKITVALQPPLRKKQIQSFLGFKRYLLAT